MATTTTRTEAVLMVEDAVENLLSDLLDSIPGVTDVDTCSHPEVDAYGVTSIWVEATVQYDGSDDDLIEAVDALGIPVATGFYAAL